MQDLEGNPLAARVPREKDPGVSTLTDLPFDVVVVGESLPYQRPLSLRKRRCVAKSVYANPKRSRVPAAHSKLSIRLQQK